MKQPETQCIYNYSRNGVKFSTGSIDAAVLRNTEGEITVEELDLKTGKKIVRPLNLV